MASFIKLVGVRQNNLKNISIDIPHEKFVCITGPSGSGKSSLAFDTIYAEGYRRYVESLSTYARQFMERMPRPDLDSVENICPSVALQQNNPVKNSRSTVGTTTEIYDYLRLMFSKSSEAICPKCQKPIKSETPETAADQILSSLTKEERGYIGFPLKEALTGKQLIERGFLRRLKSATNPEAISLEDDPSLTIREKSLIVYDRLVFSQQDRHRLIESLEGSFREGAGKAFVYLVGQTKPLQFNSEFRCTECDIALPKPSPLLFSFNSPLGACADCKGFGNILEYDEALLVPNQRLSLDRGAVEPFTKPIMKKAQSKLIEFAKKNKIPTHESWSDLKPEQRKLLLHGSGAYKGIVGVFKKGEKKRYKVHVRVFLRRYQTAFLCMTCQGSRLRKEALSYKIKGSSLFDLVSLSIGELQDWLSKIRWSPADQIILKEVLRQITGRLHFLNRMGLGYLSLHRLTRSLSGGECQRINLANQLGAELSGTLYILDEPSIGLHPCDRDRLLSSIRELVSLGNSVIVVEHDLETMKASDQIIEMGPGSGTGGGAIVFQGNLEDFSKASTLTSRYLKGELRLPEIIHDRSEVSQWLTVKGAKENNLKNITLNLPLNRLVGIAGVSGSGKSTLIHQTLFNALARLYHQETEPIGRFEKIFGTDHLKGVVLLDQSPLMRSSRSLPMTIIGAYDDIRNLFASTIQAKRLHLLPKHFSFNVNGGRCETCMGEGLVKTEMFFLEDLHLTCETCNGARFKKEILSVEYKGKSIHDIFHMTTEQAIQFFSDHRALRERFEVLRKVGLDYLQLGQSSHTLSGGESQRLKIATELMDKRKKQILYILDEPTTGLHINEVGLLLKILKQLVESGNSVVVIEHHLDVLKSCDWLIELGPGAGKDGGRIVAEGFPEHLVKEPTKTAPYLKKVMVA